MEVPYYEDEKGHLCGLSENCSVSCSLFPEGTLFLFLLSVFLFVSCDLVLRCGLVSLSCPGCPGLRTSKVSGCAPGCSGKNTFFDDRLRKISDVYMVMKIASCRLKREGEGILGGGELGSENEAANRIPGELPDCCSNFAEMSATH